MRSALWNFGPIGQPRLQRRAGVGLGGGPLCTLLDLLADRMELPVAQLGDLVVVFQSGAHGASASPQAFLGHLACAEVLV